MAEWVTRCAFSFFRGISIKLLSKWAKSLVFPQSKQRIQDHGYEYKEVTSQYDVRTFRALRHKSPMENTERGR